MYRTEITLAGMAVLLLSSGSSFAQSTRQCAPAVNQPEMFRNCRIVATQGSQICRCDVSPAGIRAGRPAQSVDFGDVR
jgi:hypothetical protein